MPFYKHVSKLNSLFAIWKIEEKEKELLEQTILSSEESIEYAKINNYYRRSQWLCVRVALKHMMEDSGEKYYGLYKNEKGKPIILNKHNKYQISFSHCDLYGIAALSKYGIVGVDIQKIDDKLDRIKTKFLSPIELEYKNLDLNKLCILWSIKEAVYKMLDINHISLKTDVIIKDFEIASDGSANVQCRNYKIDVEYELFKNYIVCYAFMNN